MKKFENFAELIKFINYAKIANPPSPPIWDAFLILYEEISRLERRIISLQGEIDAVKNEDADY